jgi:hypothetical protein
MPPQREALLLREGESELRLFGRSSVWSPSCPPPWGRPGWLVATAMPSWCKGVVGRASPSMSFAKCFYCQILTRSCMSSSVQHRISELRRKRQGLDYSAAVHAKTLTSCLQNLLSTHNFVGAPNRHERKESDRSQRTADFSDCSNEIRRIGVRGWRKCDRAGRGSQSWLRA